jgi:hypothetical protein
MLPLDRPSIEDLAQTTEPQMVRRRFDDQNLVWAYAMSWLFAFASLILVLCLGGLGPRGGRAGGSDNRQSVNLPPV